MSARQIKRSRAKPRSRTDVRRELERLLEVAATDMRTRWDRDLPVGEHLADRWRRAKRLGFAAGSSIYDSSYVYGEVSVGEGTWIGPLTVLDGSGGLRIGHHCSISSGVMIFTHDTVQWALSGGTAGPEREPVSIGDCCYIGSQAVIAKGVRIGERCVVGAGAFVNRDVPAGTVVAGVPARRIGRVVRIRDLYKLVYDRRTRRT